MQINGLHLPTALMRAIGERRWRRPAVEVLRRVFRESPIKVQLYDLDEMRAANHRWLEEKDPAYFGRSDAKKPPGNIDPARSLLLGLLGPHMPFALDYRTSDDRPSVLYLHSGGDQWITVAGDIEQLLARLQLDGLPAGLDSCAPARRVR
ncbi:hypothetical protein [Nannocystis punicea]|uniref:Alpha/beta hydrolase n=1 Tax=Nannocystis punicea TaxID=2995304 RepID=A0ABY7H324_9BACT|nr:hypothetical protein [Nannocystis poenicansa]WAS93668.1 hypothetical protein O0S08_46645 [Nannocystis poenicansa]